MLNLNLGPLGRTARRCPGLVVHRGALLIPTLDKPATIMASMPNDVMVHELVEESCATAPPLEDGDSTCTSLEWEQLDEVS